MKRVTTAGLRASTPTPMNNTRSTIPWTVVSVVLSVSCTVGAFGAGCGSEDNSSFPEGGSTSGSTSGSSGSTGGFNTTITPKDACSDAAKLVYVLSQEKELYSFTPNTLTFAKIGKLACPTSATPVSMAVDRGGTAWVNYANGELYKVSTRDASCVKTSFEPNQQGFLKFGMAFSTNDATSDEETLYISGLSDTGISGKGFGKIDLSTLKVTMLGEYTSTLAGKAAELTGTGDGRLYGFFITAPNATLAQIDRVAGATSNDKALEGVNTGNAFAFSFWGGDFWFYTTGGSEPSKVTQLKASAGGELAVVMKDVGGFRIVGAGVSTCAPITPPK
jgi:hypothetical protein